MKKIVIFFILVISFVWGEKIKSVEFKGLVHISKEIAEEVAEIYPKEELDIEKVDKALKKFYSYGYFEDIWVDFENGRLIFYFTEKPMIAKIDVVGYLESKKEEWPEILGIKKGDIYDEDIIEEAKRKIIQKTKDEGYYDSVVEVETEKLNKESVKVTFVVNKGENIIIREIKVCSKKNIFEKSDIEKNIVNKERDFLGWMWGFNSGEAKIDQLPFDMARARDIYLQKGYLDVKVSNPLLKVDFNTYNAKLFFHIKEGEPYIVDKVEISLDKDVIKKKELYKKLKLKKGKVFDSEKLRKDVKRIKEKIADLGYAYVRIMPDFKKDSKNHTVKVIYKVFVGKKVFVNDVIISGNQRTLDRVIRREVYLAPGDKYSLTDLKDSKNALKRTGFFENVKIEERRVSEDKIDLIVDVKEMPTGNIMVGGGYGSYEGMILNASISDKNIFGSGIEASFSVDYSSKSLSFDVGVFNPRVYDSDYSLGVDLYDTSYEFYDYTQDKSGVSINVGKRLSRYLRASVGYVYESIELSDVDFDSIYFQEGKYTKSAITPVLYWDNTDDYYVPREGIAGRVSLEYAGVGGDEEYVKFYGKMGYFYGLEDIIDYDWIFRYKARLGYIFENGYLPVNEKFYMGGIRSVRGYSSGSISPVDKKNRLIGGKALFSNSFELSIPVLDSAKMRVALFYDFGMIGEDSFTEIKRSGTGAALEWLSPMGPIQLVFAKAINSKPIDRTATFEFSIGTKF